LRRSHSELAFLTAPILRLSHDGVDAQTGKSLWSYDRTAQGSPANIPTPVAADALVYSAAGRSGGGLVRLKAEKNFTSRLMLSIRPMEYVSSFLLYELTCTGFKRLS
jgi:hypothetical protein